MREKQLSPLELKYIEIQYGAVTQGYLREYCKQNGFDLSIRFNGAKQDPSRFDFHSTVWFTTSEHRLPNDSLDCDVTVYPKGFALFGPEKNILVMEIESDNLQEIRDHYGNKYGMEDEWPDFSPHITVCYNYKGDGLPDAQLPDFPLNADTLNIKTQQKF